ncbi:ABC transporter substrate-binding protein [Mesorhizobium sp. VK9D]|uniref:ABC transporter substrate-binding protein n=1 Tax=Mesorhizobium australafricanum TaxID=3072311 RepID=UPI002A23E6B3|nr:ABC transporter substrate-binding protein [Mesorhizobium sp. VK9D]MDX8457107.1 ABC transporter substrate-binding protein [Mesorhizobium sp. VK9D]
MGILINRRRFMQTTSTALAVGAISSVAGRASAASPGELRIVLNGGDVGKAHIEAYAKPFEAETGIKVTPITQDFGNQQLELMVKTNNVTVDVGAMIQVSALEAAAKGLLEEIDYSIHQKGQLDAIVDFAKEPFGLGYFIYSYVMVWNTEKFPAGKPRPTTWAEFWDVQKFPAVRLLPGGQYGTEGPWEEALLADGVPADQLYPMEIDRIFSSLERIKPHIRKWWMTGSEIQQLMQSGTGDVMNSYDGRALTLIDKGAGLEINRDQAKLTTQYWVIPKGSPNAHNAQRFIEFASRADRQAAFAQLIPYGPTNRNAFKLIPETLARRLASHPDYMTKSIPIDGRWYVEAGSDGLTNAQRLSRRWSDWVIR